LLADRPAEALQIIEDGLGRAPENESLLQLNKRLTEHLRELDTKQKRASALVQAHAALTNNRYSEAKQILQETITAHGTNEEIDHLLALVATAEAQAEQQKLASPTTSSLPTHKTTVLQKAVVPATERIPPKVDPPHRVSKSPSRRWPLYAGFVTIAVALSAGIGLVVAHRRTAVHPVPAEAQPIEQSPAPVPAKSDLEINAIPWGRVMEIHDSQGRAVQIPNEDRTTPLRLEGLAEGKYTVILSGPQDQSQTLECNLTATNHLCSAQMGTLDITQILKGASQ
jgi:serine/threonine-protein kinase